MMKNNKDLLTDLQVSMFCMELSMLIKAGMPLDQGLLSLIEDEKTDEKKELYKCIYNSLDEGSTFYEALLSSGVFPKYVVDMILIGEKTGNLENILEELHIYYQREDELYVSIKSAVLYPLIMIAMMFIVLMVLVLKILPAFNDIYYELGSTIPPAAVYIMKSGNIMSKFVLIILGLVVMGYVVSVFYEKISQGKKLFSFKEKVLGGSKIALLIGQARFTSVLSLAFSSGLELDYALDLAAQMIDNEEIQKKIKECKGHLDGGESFSDAIEKSQIIKGTYGVLLSIGFKTGNSDKAMRELSKRYSMEVDNKINAIISAIEPTLVITMSVLVGVILLLVMLPLLGIMSSIG